MMENNILDLNNETETTIVTQYKEGGPSSIKADGYFNFSTRIHPFHADEHPPEIINTFSGKLSNKDDVD